MQQTVHFAEGFCVRCTVLTCRDQARVVVTVCGPVDVRPVLRFLSKSCVAGVAVPIGIFRVDGHNSPFLCSVCGGNVLS